MIMLSLLVTILLTACEKASSSIVIPSCPPLVGYTQEQTSDVADKMEAAKDKKIPEEVWMIFIDDYYALRQNVREMCGEKT